MHPANGAGPHARGPDDTLVPVPFAEAVHGCIEVEGFFLVVKKVDLVIARYQVAEAHPDKPYQQPSLVKPFKKVQHFRDQLVVRTRIGDPQLFGTGVEIRIPDLYRYAGG